MQNFKNNLISIITVVKNAEETIEKSIQSVINQNYDNIEYIIANGDIIGFLNSGDIYYPDALMTVNNYFIENKIDFLFGSVEKYKLMHGYKPWKLSWSFGFYTSHSVGFFIKTNKHKMVGLYDQKFLSADLDFFLKMIKKFKLNGISSKKSEVFGKFEKGGFSSKVNYIQHLKDLNYIRLNNSQNIFFVYFFISY